MNDDISSVNSALTQRPYKIETTTLTLTASTHDSGVSPLGYYAQGVISKPAKAVAKAYEYLTFNAQGFIDWTSETGVIFYSHKENKSVTITVKWLCTD